MIARAGTGPEPIPASKLTAESLADAIRFCLKPETQTKARELAAKMESEKGSEVGAESFHTHLTVDHLRCMLAPKRAAVWRVRDSRIVLSPFAACTLVDAKLLTFDDLKLYKPCTYVVDEGPFDPISGGFVAFVGAVTGMSRGLIDVPSETWKAAKLPFRSQNSRANVSVRPASTHDANLSQEMNSPTSSQDHPSSSPTTSKPHQQLSQDSSSVPLRRDSASTSSTKTPKAITNDKASDKSRDKIRHRGAHVSKGIGRFATALTTGPMEIALSMNKGLYNLPKAWGDDTVRHPDRVTGFRSGFKAAGKDFGLGWYDGITGLVTQPWKGAQRDGASGFFKGVGKGVGGFVAKPCATIFGVPGYMMKGVQKGCQKWFTTNIQDYIFASRVAQGYEEWIKSSEMERQEVIKQWGVVKEYLDKKSSSDEMLKKVLELNTRPGRDTEPGSQ
jgi:hypothetical protein